MWELWLIVAGIFFVLEIITVGFLVFWLAIGALITMIFSFFVQDILIQCSIFVVSSSLLILLTKPFVKKFVEEKSTATNAYSIVGKKAIVIKQIEPNQFGQIKLGSETWTAKCELPDISISEKTEVEIVGIDGVKAIVKPCSVNITK